jgi:hypothetical protein
MKNIPAEMETPEDIEAADAPAKTSSPKKVGDRLKKMMDDESAKMDSIKG